MSLQQINITVANAKSSSTHFYKDTTKMQAQQLIIEVMR